MSPTLNIDTPNSDTNRAKSEKNATFNLIDTYESNNLNLILSKRRRFPKNAVNHPTKDFVMDPKNSDAGQTLADK